MTQESIRNDVLRFIRENFLFDEKREIGADQSLLGSGLVDSTGILELIGFLEETYGLKFKDSELVADNFDSLTKIAAFVDARKSQQ